ncbi:VOC family protein [Thermodesulfobacteriota bacterium]
MNKETTDIFELKPHHCGISIPDLENSIVWYRDMLGFSIEKRVTIEEANAKVAFVKKGNFMIELFEVAGASPLPDSRRYPNQDIAVHGTKHITFEVPDLRKLMDTLKHRGVDVAMDVFEIEDSLAAFIRDNSGILIELFECLEQK